MHTLNRITVVTVLAMGLVPLATFAIVTDGDRRIVQDNLNHAIDAAQSSYRHRAGAAALKSRSEKVISETEQKILSLAREKRLVREKLAKAYRSLEQEQGVSLDLLRQHEQSLRLYSLERVRIRQFLHDLHLRRISILSTGPSIGNGILRLLMRGSIGDRTEQELQEIALSQARAHLLLMLLEAGETAKLSQERLTEALGSAASSVVGLQKRLFELQGEYRTNQQLMDHAEHDVALTEVQLKEVKVTVAEVHAQVLAMQSELARIDARIARRAERALIDKGLLSGRPGEHAEGKVSSAVGFGWPAYGRVSAGFHDLGYFAYFGVPHEGMDIVVGQGSPVFSAADGVVFVVREGGATGYTYVLIGHRDGFATLYGHLSQVSVYPGQDISKGQPIGLSGGMPGTPGAGLMTTAPHLHFEVIQRGVNVDPHSVLP